MSYPFRSWPRLWQIVNKLEKEFGCKCEVKDITRGDGKTARITIIERQIGEVTRECVIEGKADKPMGPTQIESMCNRLRNTTS